jgi:hypothetical protein
MRYLYRTSFFDDCAHIAISNITSAILLGITINIFLVYYSPKLTARGDKEDAVLIRLPEAQKIKVLLHPEECINIEESQENRPSYLAYFWAVLCFVFAKCYLVGIFLKQELDIKGWGEEEIFLWRIILFVDFFALNVANAIVLYICYLNVVKMRKKQTKVLRAITLARPTTKEHLKPSHAVCLDFLDVDSLLSWNDYRLNSIRNTIKFFNFNFAGPLALILSLSLLIILIWIYGWNSNSYPVLNSLIYRRSTLALALIELIFVGFPFVVTINFSSFVNESKDKMTYSLYTMKRLLDELETNPYYWKRHFEVREKPDAGTHKNLIALNTQLNHHIYKMLAKERTDDFEKFLELKHDHLDKVQHVLGSIIDQLEVDKRLHTIYFLGIIQLQQGVLTTVIGALLVWMGAGFLQSYLGMKKKEDF